MYKRQSKYFGYRGAVISIGTITLVATLAVWLFLDSEKDKIARGDKMEGDEPIRLKSVSYTHLDVYKRQIRYRSADL